MVVYVTSQGSGDWKAKYRSKLMGFGSFRWKWLWVMDLSVTGRNFPQTNFGGWNILRCLRCYYGGVTKVVLRGVRLAYVSLYMSKICDIHCDNFERFSYPEPMEPPPSQSNMSISHPCIFVNKDSSRIQVFAEACSIRGRPKLMRTLRVSHVIFSSCHIL
jgi:hypothetical protein